MSANLAGRDATGLADAMNAFAGISESLVKSYEALSVRAQHVEAELERTNAELAGKVAELDQVNRDLEAVLRSLPTGVIVRDADGSILRANATAAALSEARALPASLEREELHETTGPDGTRRSVATRRSIVRDERGEPAGFVDILDDRTELVAMTERVHVLDKMAALGTMGGGIAHEIRNPLNAVRGFAALLERELADEPKLGRWASRIVEGASEADAIIASLLAFASPERVCNDEVDGATLLRDAARAALGEEHEREGRAGDAARHRLTLKSTAPAFLGDRIKLRQMLRNLIANSAQAQPDGGAIEATLELHADAIVARVRDAGPGIPRELRGKVTDPFFTTRPEGSGLGLALVATIARLHGGSVEVSAAPSRLGGAEITVSIPYQQPVPTPSPIAEEGSELKKAS